MFQGVGYPLDIVVCSALGADMYDCVYPTRTARFGTALVPEVICLEIFWVNVFNLVNYMVSCTLVYIWMIFIALGVNLLICSVLVEGVNMNCVWCVLSYKFWSYKLTCLWLDLSIMNVNKLLAHALKGSWSENKEKYLKELFLCIDYLNKILYRLPFYRKYTAQ